MASFTDRLDDWKPPTADDLDIALPIRREPKKETASEEARDLGQHGGSSDAGTPDGHAEAAAPAEPAPQRDEPDEGEHTDSTQEQVAARAAQRAAETAVDEPEESAPGPAADEPVGEASLEKSAPEPQPARRRSHAWGAEGYRPEMAGRLSGQVPPE